MKPGSCGSGYNNNNIPVGITTRLRVERTDFDSRDRQESRLFSTKSCPVLESTKIPCQWVQAALFSVINWPEREAEYQPPSTGLVENEWRCTSIPFICPHGINKDTFAFTLIIIITCLKFCRKISNIFANSIGVE
jgi:hypothetical protein